MHFSFLRINSQIINFMNAYDHIDYYLAGMPAKNNPNPAKTPIFPRFMPNSPSPVPPSTNKVAFDRNHRK